MLSSLNRRQFFHFLGSNALLSALIPDLPWNYKNIEQWGELSPDFQRCATGRQQTPIDLQKVTATESASLTFNYHPTPLKILNNGRTIQVNYEAGSSLRFQGETFQLLQFHFHHPSEHQIGGKPFDLEIHFVHRSEGGKLAVLGILAKKGLFNPYLQRVWSALPTRIQTSQTIENIQVNALQFLPNHRDFYEYRGSLTTPPCSEDVLWLVMANSIEVSPQQIQQFVAIFPLNARPIQPLNDRPILHSR